MKTQTLFTHNPSRLLKAFRRKSKLLNIFVKLLLLTHFLQVTLLEKPLLTITLLNTVSGKLLSAHTIPYAYFSTIKCFTVYNIVISLALLPKAC